MRLDKKRLNLLNGFWPRPALAFSRASFTSAASDSISKPLMEILPGKTLENSGKQNP
jgi:hypothetical protein